MILSMDDIKTILIHVRESIRYQFVCPPKRKLLKNRDFTWISSNCTGAIITHELQCRFNTPTVNLFIKPSDFIKFVRNIDEYAEKEFKYEPELSRNCGYPVAKLDDITVYFVHYHTFEEAVNKWKQRYARIDKDNIFIMMSEKDGCTYDDLQEFDKLPYKNKIVLTHKPYPEIKSAVYITGFENQEQLGDVFRMRKLFSLTKYYDEFDFVKWLNEGEKK